MPRWHLLATILGDISFTLAHTAQKGVISFCKSKEQMLRTKFTPVSPVLSMVSILKLCLQQLLILQSPNVPISSIWGSLYNVLYVVTWLPPRHNSSFSSNWFLKSPHWCNVVQSSTSTQLRNTKSLWKHLCTHFWNDCLYQFKYSQTLFLYLLLASKFLEIRVALVKFIVVWMLRKLHRV